MEIGPDRAASYAIDLAVEVGGSMEVGGYGIGSQAGIVGISGGVIAPKRCRRCKVFVHSAKQIDIGAVRCGAEPAAGCWKRGDRHPRMARRGVFISARDGDVIGDSAETIDTASLGRHGLPGNGDRI